MRGIPDPTALLAATSREDALSRGRGLGMAVTGFLWRSSARAARGLVLRNNWTGSDFTVLRRSRWLAVPRPAALLATSGAPQFAYSPTNRCATVGGSTVLRRGWQRGHVSRCFDLVVDFTSIEGGVSAFVARDARWRYAGLRGIATKSARLRAISLARFIAR